MKWKGIWLRLIPVVILVVITLIMSISVYRNMKRDVEEICWNRLENATNSTADKIWVRLNDNINFLKSSADAYVLSQDFEKADAVGEYLKSAMEGTVFERLDIILPDNTIITQEGTISERGGESTYEQLVAVGTHVTARRTSSFHGGEVICIVTPIEYDGEVKGLLVGTISCETLGSIFRVFTYGESSQIFIIDRADGNYIVDNWHSELKNIYDMGDRTGLDGEEIDMITPIVNGERVRLAYVSQSNGQNTYMYSAPIEEYNWTLCVAVQEDVVFSNVELLKHRMGKVAIVELFLLLVYVLWNIALNIVAVKNENALQKMEFEKVKTDARNKFISNMSHDIKTPLNGIVGMIEIAKNHDRDLEVINNCLRKIEISAKYLSTLTSDVLDIGEIENNKVELLEEPLDLRVLLGDITSIMERMAENVGVTYSLDTARLKNAYIIGSMVHIKRVLINLISNAIKYSKNAGAKVWVMVSDEEYIAGKRMYRFVIKDNGIGMSEEFQKNMYQAFEQEYIDARSEYQGYGLGLTIVKYLVKKMNGTIELDSQKGQGTTFTISIPFELSDDKCIRTQQKTENITLTGMKILLVEDNEFNMEVAETLLSDAGAVVSKAINGKIAIEMFEKVEEYFYDVILMDVMMPEMDGCEATRIIRGMERRDGQAVPIIAMTASTFAEDVKRCKEAGMSGFIPKPLDVTQLMTTILECNSR